MQKIWFALLVSIVSISTHAGEEDLYDFLWLDPDKTVYVLQNKIYPKEKSIYLDLGYLTNLTSTFQDTFGAQVKVGYFISEEWAVEFNYLKYSNSDNSTLKAVKDVTGSIPFIRRPLSSSALFAIWSPFYGKINTFNKIYYFDWSFGLGVGSYEAESNLKSATTTGKDLFENENYTSFLIKSSLKFHLNRSFHIGLEFLNTNFEAATPSNPNSKSWDQNNDIIFSIGASF
ncbi:MAG: outer membrane beta-barrel domain-containing protein [Halobacteriovoraceae bacterium]|jgi:outer membrane beta-barrel protein|nr:outer membrane beta-barrel domain-containing protein [Halobacteriovoraceae bacterium]